MLQYTPTEQRIIDALKDGMPHPRADVLKCLNDSQADYNALAVRLFHLRRKVRVIGQDIITEYYRGGYFYRHVILLSGKDPLGDDPL